MASRSDSPYVGPRPFQRGESEIFFGRAREKRDLLSVVISHGEVLLHSLSGAGKSSLINAGLIPNLEEEGFEVLPPARVQGLLPTGHNPQEIDNLYVFNALLSWVEAGSAVQQLMHLPLVDYFKQRARKTTREGKPRPRVVIFDQFEELFTFYPERWQDRTDFLKQVSEALHEDASLRVIFVMRNEYVAQLLSFSSLFPERLRTRFSLERLRYEGALAAVKRPAEKGGRTFAAGVAERLVEDLIQGPVVTSTGETQTVRGEFVEPVQLQVVCDRLWRELPPQVDVIGLEHLKTFGDVNQALIRYYEAAVANAAQAARVRQGRLRKWFETRLITDQGTRATVPRGEGKTGGIPNSAVDVLQELHLVRPENRAGAHWYELTHDRLIEPIQLVARQKRRHRLRAAVVMSVVVGLMGISALVYLSIQNWELRQKQRALAVITDPKTDPEIRVRTALQQVLSSYAEGQEVLPELPAAARRAVKALQLWPRLYFIDPFMKDMAFGHDDLLLATVGSDHIVRIRERGTGRELWKLPAHTEAVQRIAFSQDARTLTTVDKTGTVRVWEAPWDAPRNVQFTIRAGGIFAFSPDGKSIVTHDSQKVIVWDAFTGKDRVLSTSSDKILKNVRALAFSQKADRFAIGYNDGTIMVWGHRHKAAPLRYDEALILRGHAGQVRDIAFVENGELLVSAGEDRTAKVWDIEFGNELLTLSDHTRAVTRVVATPDGMRLATYSTDEKVRIWNISPSIISGPVRSFYEHQKGVKSLAFSAVGGFLATIDGMGNLQLRNVDSGQNRWPSQEKAQFQDVALSRDGMRVATLDNNRVRIWDFTTVKALQTRSRQGAGLLAAALSPDGWYLATGSWDGSAALWDVKTKRLLLTLSGHEGAVWGVAFNHDGTQLATASKDATAKVWEVATGKELYSLVGHQKDVHRVGFDASGKRLATASWDMTAAVWDANSGQRLLTLTGHTRPVNSVAFNHDGSRLVTSASDGTVRVWNAKNGEELLTYRNHHRSVRDAVFSPSGAHIASASADKTIRVWEAETGKDLSVLSGHEGTVWSVAFSPDGSRVATASEDNRIKSWDVSAGKELHTFPGHDGRVNQVLFAPTGLISVGDDRVVRWWDIASGRELFNREVYPIRSIAMNPDATQVAAATAVEVIIWDVSEGREWTLVSPARGISKVVYSPDGRHLAATSEDGIVAVWDAKTRKALFDYKQLGQAFHSLSFSRDGSRLAAAGRHNPPRVFNVASGEPVAIIPDQPGEVLDIALSPDGNLVAAIVRGNGIHVWDVDSERPLFKLSTKRQSLNKLAFTPNGQYLAYAGISGEDGAVQLYSVAEWRPLALQDLIALGFSSLSGLTYQGAAKALNGDYQGAIRDLQTLLEQTPNAAKADTYRKWVRALEVGENPFTAKVLLQLVAD